MYKKILLSVAVICVFTACKSPKEQLSKLWMYTHLSGKAGDRNTSLSPSSFIMLQENGQYTLEFSAFDSGTWQLVNDQLELTSSRTKQSAAISFTKKKDILQLIFNSDMILNFEATPLNMEKEEENPFCIANNQWRIKATQKETDAQLKARVLNNLRYLESYFAWGLSNDLERLDVQSVPTPIKIYSNGFEVRDFDVLPESWIDVFYDEEDCKKANDMLGKEVRRMTIKWPRTDKQYKKWVGVFQQMQQNIQ